MLTSPLSNGQPQIGERQLGLPRRTRPAQHRVHSGQQLLMREGLHRIIVGTQVEALNSVERDGPCAVSTMIGVESRLPPHRANDFQAVAVRQAKIK